MTKDTDEGRDPGAALATADAPPLSLCMIVRDSSRTLAACLAGIRPWVDEMVVVDTGSVDDTPAIAAAFGARVFRFPWCDDFAAARNESLRRGRGRWLFWMDADDTIDADNGRRLRELAASAVPDDVLAHVVRVHCPASDDPGADVTAVDHVKLVRNRPDLRFEGRIHEQLLPAVRRAGGEVGWTDLFVTHSGSDRSPAGRRRKHERDLRLLQLDLRDRPGHSFVLFNLGMTLADAGDHAGAADALAAAVTAGVPGESHLRKAYALHAASLGELGRHDDALDACLRGLSFHGDDVELNFRAGLASHRVGRLDDAVEFYCRAMVPPAGRAFASIDRGLGTYKALYNLAAVYLDQRRPADAAAAYRDVVRLAPDWEPGKAALHRLLADVVRWAGIDADIESPCRSSRPSHEGCLTPSPPYAGERAGVRGRASGTAALAEDREADPADPGPSTVAAGARGREQLYARPLTLTLSPGYGGEGTGRSAAVRVCELAVDDAPRDANAHADLAVALRRAGRLDEALAAYDHALLIHRDRPAGWRPAHPREAAELGLMLEEREGRSLEIAAAAAPRGGGRSGAFRFTVLLGCYGDFPAYSVRALDAVAAGREVARHCDVLVGLNACGPTTRDRARELAGAGVVQGVVESSPNRNKDPMMRLLVEMAATPYVLWLDDDSHFVDPDWPGRVAAYLESEHPLDVAGVPARWGPRRAEDPAYAAYAAGRPWWRGDAAYPADLREWVPFVPGGLFLARTAFLRRHDFPDRGMTKALDDVLLGELVQQVGGRLAHLPPELQAVARVSDGQRRGEHFLLNPGGAY